MGEGCCFRWRSRSEKVTIVPQPEWKRWQPGDSQAEGTIGRGKVREMDRGQTLRAL